jgi:hypothetical protein
MLHISRRTYYIIAALVLLIVVVLLLPVDIPRSLSVRGSVASARDWVLLRTDNGQIVSLLRDNRNGAVEHCTMTQVDRGDAMSFVLSERMRGGEVLRGDTVGWIVSYALMQEISALEGALSVAEATVASARSGEKASLVEEARQRLAFAKAARDEQEKIHARQTELHSKNTISDELFDISADRLRQLRINVDLAEAGLRTASTGLKPEDVRAAEANVRSLRDQLEKLRGLMHQNTFITPVSGVQRSSWAVDTLLVISDITEQLLVLPVELPDLALIRPGEVIDFSIPRTGLGGSARVERIDRTVHYIGRRPVSTVIAPIERCDAGVSGGMLARCSITAPPVRPAAWALETLRKLFD